VAEIALTRTLSGLAPADDHAREVLRRWQLGETLKADVRKPRAHRSLRRYWALVNLVYQNSEQFKSPEAVHAYLKIRAGHCTPIVSKSTGEVFLVPDSISYDRLDETEFRAVWERVVQVVADEILGTGVPEIEAEIMRIVGLAP
jgi:hypothetical protein